jgi:hypothetical protein
MHQIIVPGVAFVKGTIIKHCTSVSCISYKVLRVRATRAGNVHHLAEVAGSLAVDPLIAYYDKLVSDGVLPKVARAKACKRFGGKNGPISRAQFFRRQAAR